jgi:hypothetical protein
MVTSTPPTFLVSSPFLFVGMGSSLALVSSERSPAERVVLGALPRAHFNFFDPQQDCLPIDFRGDSTQHTRLLAIAFERVGTLI